MLGFVYLTPDCWLEVSLQPEVPASSQLNSFVGFLSPRTNIVLVHKFHVALHASHAGLLMVTSKFRPNVALTVLDQNFTTMQPLECGIEINSGHAQ
jgi:hypothetical protein